MIFICLASNKKLKLFPFLCKNGFNLEELQYFVQKKQRILQNGAQSNPIFKTQSRSSFFKKMIFTETSETNITIPPISVYNTVSTTATEIRKKIRQQLYFYFCRRKGQIQRHYKRKNF